MIAAVLGMVLVLGLSGIAQAQVLPSCDDLVISVSEGVAGSTTNISGFEPSGSTYKVLLDGTQIASGTADVYGINTTFVIPASTPAGSHTITVVINYVEEDTSCPFTFVVDAAAVAPLPARLPSTGFMLIPAGGLVASGIGMFFFRKRRR